MRFTKKTYIVAAILIIAGSFGMALEIKSDDKSSSSIKTSPPIFSQTDTEPIAPQPTPTSEQAPVNVQNTATLKDNAEPQAQNPYAEGTTMWYVWGKRQELGRTLPTTWGSGNVWADKASVEGYTVDHNPEVGSVIELGHGVGIIESINQDNSVSVRYLANSVTTLSAETAAITFYVH